jgi:hypothetical protein
MHTTPVTPIDAASPRSGQTSSFSLASAVSVLLLAAGSDTAAVHPAPNRLQPAAVFTSIGEHRHMHRQAVLAWCVLIAFALVLA